MRILLAGVPFGCDNVGDEAILECAVEIFREVCPGSSITASTRDPEATAARLGIETCGLLGFFGDVTPAQTHSIIAAHDCFVWCGATGLSDYPHVTPPLMRLAQQLGKKTVLWGVGMNDELNPAFFKVRPGKRATVLNALTRLSGGTFDAIHWEEERRARRARKNIAECLAPATLRVVRDPEAKEELLKCGITQEIIVGADSALVLRQTPCSRIPAPVQQLLESARAKVAICISAQRPVENPEALIRFFDGLTQVHQCALCFVPMNPETDSALMAQLHARMAEPQHAALLSGRYDPGEILSVLAAMDLAIASRLHLLILSSIAHVPLMGIARGSKVDNFLRPFGLQTSGDVESCDARRLLDEARRLLEDKAAFQERSKSVRAMLLDRLETAKEALRQQLAVP